LQNLVESARIALVPGLARNASFEMRRDLLVSLGHFRHKGVVAKEFHQLALALGEVQAAQELAYSDLLHDVKQVDFVVEVASGLHLDAIFFGEPAPFSAAQAVATAAEPVDPGHEPAFECRSIFVAESSA
jgi:hypothetical protein